MKARWLKWLPIMIALASLVLLAAGTGDPPRINVSSPPELQTFVSGNTDLAAELLPRLGTPGGNMAFSPYGLVSVLAVAQAGAKGQTESQIASVCHFSTNQANQSAALVRVRNELTAAGRRRGIQLSSATGLWAQKDYGFEEPFLRLIRKEHGAEVKQVDFETSSDAVLDQINTWIKKNTEGKIPKAVSGHSVTPATRLIVANAIYFKGQWASRFDRGATRDGPFHVTAESSVEAPMMRQENNFLHGEKDGVQLLVLPYAGQALHMLVLLPEEGGLAELERRLNASYLESWANKLSLCKVEVLLPRFDITSSHTLTEPLQTLGLRDAFDAERADFSGMSARRPLFIQAAEQTCLIEVNEEGTVAAAATHTSFGCAAAPRLPRRQFHADRPFVFLIRENTTGVILFVGRVSEPASSRQGSVR